jgi:radical SAM superfamily enzyme YgiQ (UPF0313 family)
MRIKLVSVKQGVSSIGFRKIIPIVREVYPDAEIYFIPLLVGLLKGAEEEDTLCDKEIDNIVDRLKDADVVLFSSMTIGAKHIERISQKLKEDSPKIYLCWGGVHPTLLPEEALPYVDSVCVGEGEKVVLEIIKNRPKGIVIGPLLTSEELEQQPYAYNDFDCFVYQKGQFKQLNKYIYIKYHGLLYRTIWVRGCPYSCSYCANSSLSKVSKQYNHSRYPSASYVVEETRKALQKYSFITTVNFDDDTLIAIPIEKISEFGRRYKERVNIPFAVTGIHPNPITKEKIELLMQAGMIRMRMGIQSGSKKTLSYYNRPTSIEKIIEATDILSTLTNKYKTVPPLYDIISDNKEESIEEQFKTLQLINNLKRPFYLTLFSLRIMRKTKLEDLLGYNDKENSPLGTRPTLINILLFASSMVKIPDKLLTLLKGKLDREYPSLSIIIKNIFLLRIWIGYIFHSDFSKIQGRWAILFKRRKALPK